MDLLSKLRHPRTTPSTKTAADLDTKTYSLSDRQKWRILVGFPPSQPATLPNPPPIKISIEAAYSITVERSILEDDRAFAIQWSKLEEALSPLMLFHPGYYKLQYKLPNSPLVVNVKLDEHDRIMSAYDKFALLGLRSFTKLYFRIVPQEMSAPVFRVTEAKKVLNIKLDTRNAINTYLANEYINGRIDMKDYDNYMNVKLVDAKHLVAVHISKTVPDEFKDHAYLIKPKVKKTKKVNIEQLYVNGDISLQEFEDVKYPDLKVVRDKANATYPLPQVYTKCVICCTPDSANIKCLECKHQACRECVLREFTLHESKRPFILLHGIFCCKRGVPVRGVTGPVKKVNEGVYARHPNFD